MDIPEINYAKSGDVHIAYQVVGTGPRDLLLVPGAFGDVESLWEHPLPARFISRLASFARFILMDQRGTGSSDRSERLPSVEEQMDDLRAVLDATGSEHAALFALSQGGPLAIVFTATYPERVSALVLYGVYARMAQADDYPWGRPPGWLDEMGRFWAEHWGTGASMPMFAPTMAGDKTFEEWWARTERRAFSPGGLLTFLRLQGETDVRPVLPTIRAPTLVLQRADDTFRDPGHSRYIAERIPGAQYVEVPGTDHTPWVGDAESLLGEIEEFLTGARAPVGADRVLATVMFTDIVGSTGKAAEVGDRRWREILEEHDGLARAELDRFRGREIKRTGDGLLVTFDGPARAIRASQAIRDRVRRLGIEIRAGLHTGECELMGDDIGGIAVHIGARVAAMAGPGEVLVSSTVKDLVAGSGIEFEDRGTHDLKGVPGEWRLFSVQG